jgi:hypothetical protein
VRQGLINAVNITVQEEEDAAIKVFPLFNSAHEGYAVILEEYEECKDELEVSEYFLDNLWKFVKENKLDDAEASARILSERAVKIACEAIQVAAMANKFVESNKAKEV